MPDPVPSLVSRLLAAYCRDNGLKLSLADGHGHAGMVALPSGDRRFFVGTRFDLNSLGASEIARDKAYAAAFLKAEGLPVPDSFLVFSEAVKSHAGVSAELRSFAEKAGFPLFVKPNTGQEGRDVRRIFDAAELEIVLRDVARRHDQILVQQEAAGRELRVLVLDGEVLCAFERCRPGVTGDGVRSIADLAADSGLKETDHAAILPELTRQGLTLNAVPAHGRPVELLPVANLSRGGGARFVSAGAKASALAVASANALGLRYAGIDLIDGNEAPVVLEVNAAPGLARLWRLVEADRDKVEEIYRRVFAAAFGSG